MHKDSGKSIELSPESTTYVLPFSGTLVMDKITQPFVYCNGDALCVENEMVQIPITDKTLEIEVEGNRFTICVLCKPWSEDMRLDYNIFGRVYANNLTEKRISEEELFYVIEEDVDEEFQLSLCTFSRSYERITNNDLDIGKALQYMQRIPQVFYRPKQHLKQINEIRPAAVATRTGQESIRHLASHSEHWKGIKANGLIPERLLARVLEEDYAIYENKVAKTLIDNLQKIAQKLRMETLDCGLQISMDDTHSISSEQKIYFRAKDALLKGLDDEDIWITQTLLDEQTQNLNKIIDLIDDCKSTQLYRKLKRQGKVRGRLKQTNIFMKDKNYNYVYQLWNLLAYAQNVKSEEITQQITNEYGIFCRILFLFALRYFNFSLINENADILQGEHLLPNTYKFENWRIAIRESENYEGGFETEVFKYHEIQIDLSEFDLPEECFENILKGVRFENQILYCERILDNKEQELLVNTARLYWPKARQRSNASELKQRLYAHFFNITIPSRTILFVPWKFCLPEHVEQLPQTLAMVKNTIPAKEYDDCYILTISRPNEINGVEDVKVMNNTLFYGFANEDKHLEQDSIGVVPISISDINSYRRYTKILLHHMIAVDEEKNICPICGQPLYQDKNRHYCRNTSCIFELIETRCPKCRKEYLFSRYPLSKLAPAKLDSLGFKLLYEENRFSFKNITDSIVENEKIRPICPHCGHNSADE